MQCQDYNMNQIMEHKGVILKLTDDTIYVQIKQVSACSDCHAKAVCSMADAKEKIIEIPSDKGNYSIGEEVTIIGKTSMGLKAVLFAFVIPLILILFTLFIFKNEGIASVISLMLLVVYYLALYLLRNWFKKKFTFEIRR